MKQQSERREVVDPCPRCGGECARGGWCYKCGQYRKNWKDNEDRPSEKRTVGQRISEGFALLHQAGDM